MAEYINVEKPFLEKLRLLGWQVIDQGIGIPQEPATQDDEVSIEYDIATYPSDFTLQGIVDMWNEGDIEIPEFQREFVWTIKQSSLLIESFLLGLPVPPVFFYVDDVNKNLVIDGQQRIISIVFFFDEYFGVENLQGKRQVFRLKGLSEKSPYHEKIFSELSDPDQRKLKNTVLRAINIRQLSPKGQRTSIYHIFERLNTGGTPLKPQEIRNCVFRGGFVKVLRDLNADKHWRSILGKTTFDKHQKDVELVLRLFALSKRVKDYEKPMKEFLNTAMEKNRSGSSDRVKHFIEVFPKTARLIAEKLSIKPFHVRGPLNTSALDSVFCTIMDNIEKIPANIKERYQSLLMDSSFQETTFSATTDANIIKKRFEMAKTHLIR